MSIVKSIVQIKINIFLVSLFELIIHIMVVNWYPLGLCFWCLIIKYITEQTVDGIFCRLHLLFGKD